MHATQTAAERLNSSTFQQHDHVWQVASASQHHACRRLLSIRSIEHTLLTHKSNACRRQLLSYGIPDSAWVTDPQQALLALMSRLNGWEASQQLDFCLEG